MNWIEDRLTVSAEIKESSSENTEKFKVKEFFRSSFNRSFMLPENMVVQEDIKAHYENGVLSIELPRRKRLKPQPRKRIAIS
ncbi:MAG: Hsp20/alpha crystallin family protein [Owenweeksia sp.]|nr:Hsp20/alpha crystallin family protein [Owenweeksia sp.]